MWNSSLYSDDILLSDNQSEFESNSSLNFFPTDLNDNYQYRKVFSNSYSNSSPKKDNPFETLKYETTDYSSKILETPDNNIIDEQKYHDFILNLKKTIKKKKVKTKYKHDKTYADNLRKETLRKCLKSYDEKILKRAITKNKENKRLWKPNIPNKNLSSLKKLKKFAKRSMRDIYEDSKLKNCSLESINKNQDNLKKIYESSKSPDIKYLFDLEFIKVIKIYLNKKKLGKRKARIFNGFSFEKDFKKDDNKNKRKKVIEKFIESVENDENVENDESKE